MRKVWIRWLIVSILLLLGGSGDGMLCCGIIVTGGVKYALGSIKSLTENNARGLVKA